MLHPPPQSIDIHRTGITATVSLNPKADPSVSVRIGKKLIWRDIPRTWHPWKLAEIDVRHDGTEEFIVALHKHTRHSPSRLHTLFVYGFDGKRVFPVWRGSTLGRDFEDFGVWHSPKGDVLVTIDRLLDGHLAVACHSWNGFGFEKTWEHGGWKRATLKITKDGAEVRAEDGRHEFGISPR